MKKRIGILVAVALIFLTGIIGGGTLIHNHSSNSSGGLLPGGSVPWATPGTIGSTTPNTGAFTSVITPVVQSSGSADFTNQVGVAYGWSFSISPDVAFFPVSSDNVSNIGRPTKRWLTGFISNIDTGTTGSGTLKTNNGTTVLTWANDLSTTLEGTINVKGGTIDSSLGTLNIKQGGTQAIAVLGANSTVAGTLSSTKACATNYTRIGPNFCLAIPTVGQAWSNLVACTDRTFTNALPTGAKVALLRLTWTALSNNAVASRTNTVLFSNLPAASSCPGASQSTGSQFTVQEFVATVAGTQIGAFTDHVLVPITATNTFTTSQTNAGGNGNTGILQSSIDGYFD